MTKFDSNWTIPESPKTIKTVVKFGPSKYRCHKCGVACADKSSLLDHETFCQGKRGAKP